MPRIKKLVLRDPVGVPSSCCTTTSERIGHWIKTRRSLARFSAPVSSVQAPSWVDFITTIVGFRVFGTYNHEERDLGPRRRRPQHIHSAHGLRF
jgi:hypothetical protein